MNVLPIQNKNIKKKAAHNHMINVNLLSSQLPSFWREPSFSWPQNSTLAWYQLFLLIKKLKDYLKPLLINV